MNLPFDGELTPAPQKKFKETVVMVHHFGGNKKTLARHASLFNDLGFDVVRFNLIFNDVKPTKRLPITGDLRFGVRHLWVDQIESILNSIPGPKIVFSLSMPSNSALEAIARRQAKDITAIICDGGPFLDLGKCIWNLYTHEFSVKSKILRAAFSSLSLALYGLGAKDSLKELLQQIPPGFPVLSIRGERDPLVSSNSIDKFFASQSHLKIETVSFLDGEHLDGLKRFPEEYTDYVRDFLDEIASKLKGHLPFKHEPQR